MEGEFDELGDAEGLSLGDALDDGLKEGLLLEEGDAEGEVELLGDKEGELLGLFEGELLGLLLELGEREGLFEGEFEGEFELEGDNDGELLGEFEGELDELGDAEGLFEGEFELEGDADGEFEDEPMKGAKEAIHNERVVETELFTLIVVEPAGVMAALLSELPRPSFPAPFLNVAPVNEVVPPPSLRENMTVQQLSAAVVSVPGRVVIDVPLLVTLLSG